MKKLLFLFCLLSPSILFAQYTFYKDSSYNQSFNLLSGSNSVNNGHFWDDTSVAIPIGFTFKLFSESTDTLYLSKYVGFGAYLNMHPVSSSTPFVTGIIATGSDLQDRDTSGNGSFSPISYSLSGTSPSRVFKLEWKNAGFFKPIDAGTSWDDSLDLQLWLFEGNNNVEVHFGNGNYNSPAYDLYNGAQGPWVAIYDKANVNMNARIYYSFKDSVQSPTLDSFSNLSSLALPPGMIGNPVAGSVYRFSPIASAIGTGYTIVNSVASNEVNYFNEKNELRIDIYNEDQFHYAIMDIQGHVLLNGAMSKGRKNISTTGLSKGMYILHLNSSNENNTFKFIR